MSHHGTPGIKGFQPIDRYAAFWPKVRKTEICWVWEGPIDIGGYGRFFDKPAHRFSYEQRYGPVPSGLDLGHLCHDEDTTCPGGRICPHRRCVNPDHLQPMTRSENLRSGHMHREGDPRAAQWQRAKTHCPRGHPYDEANTYVLPTRPTARYCRACHTEQTSERRARIRDAASSARTSSH